jgi:tripartite-type tricarboxylate transporter receptor subunit TctC
MLALPLIRTNRVWTFVFLMVSVFLFLGGTSFGAAEDYPSRPITVNVGFPPGAVSGLIAQTYSESMKKYLPNSQPVVVNFKPGASGAIAADYVLKQTPDGYNLFLFPVDLCMKLAKDGHELRFKLDDFIQVGTAGTSPTCLLVNKEGPYKTFEDFLDSAKKNPGKVSYGTPGIGSLIHYVGEVLQIRCGVKLNHVPFPGGAQAVTAVLGKHIDCYLGSVAAAGTHIKPEGGLRVLAVFARERAQDVPDVPTALEKGYDIDIITWHGLSAPKGTPQPVVKVLVETFQKVAADPQVKDGLSKVGYNPVNWSLEETSRRAKQEYELSKAVFTQLGLTK